MFRDSIIFEKGFLGTEASLYMDLTTIYFAFLPLLLAYSIKAAIKNQIKTHMRSQIIIFIITLIVIIIFETGIRIEGGFIEYADKSKIPFSYLFAFLTIHINVAIVSIFSWIYLLFATLKVYKRGNLSISERKSHKKMGKYVFMGLFSTSLMGVAMYLSLFVYIK